jgi:hypothetical protein
MRCLAGGNTRGSHPGRVEKRGRGLLAHSRTGPRALLTVPRMWPPWGGWQAASSEQSKSKSSEQQQQSMYDCRLYE